MNACTCYPVPEEYWTTHYGAVDPATTLEPNYDCPEHFPKVVAPKNATPLQEMAAQLAQQFGTSMENATRALQQFHSKMQDPREELRWRLNERLQGRDPGHPVNWRGAKGLVQV